MKNSEEIRELPSVGDALYGRFIAADTVFLTGLNRVRGLAVLLVLLLLSGRDVGAQAAAHQARFSPTGTASVLAVPSRPLTMRERHAMVPRAAAESRKHHPILVGALIGAAAGTYIGHVNGGARLCPDYPGIECRQPRWGTATGAIGGAVIGGIVGLLFEKY